VMFAYVCQVLMVFVTAALFSLLPSKKPKVKT
jgi:hypothetical protein